MLAAIVVLHLVVWRGKLRAYWATPERQIAFARMGDECITAKGTPTEADAPLFSSVGSLRGEHAVSNASTIALVTYRDTSATNVGATLAMPNPFLAREVSQR
jgi:hypothetical protein